MTTYKEKDLRELYRIDNKYWKTGDADLLSARIDAAEKFEFWVPQDPVVDKKAIKEFLKDSETCEFAHLTTTQSLRIS